MYTLFKMSQMHLRKWWQCWLLCLSMLSPDQWHSVLLIGRPGKTVLLLIGGYMVNTVLLLIGYPVNTVAMKLIHLNSGRLSMRAKKPKRHKIVCVYQELCSISLILCYARIWKCSINKRPEMILRGVAEQCRESNPRITMFPITFAICIKLRITIEQQKAIPAQGVRFHRSWIHKKGIEIDLNN